jgi:hypothetical protein
LQAPGVRDELLIRLGARCGLRVSESVCWERPDGEQVPGVRPRDLREREVDGQLWYFLKDATHWVQHERADRVNDLLLDHLNETD